MTPVVEETDTESEKEGLTWSMVVSVLLHVAFCLVIILVPFEPKVKDIHPALLANIIERPTVTLQPLDLEPAEAAAPDPEHSGVEDVPEAEEDVAPEDEAPAPPAEEEPEPEPEPEPKPKPEPKPAPKPEPKVEVKREKKVEVKVTDTLVKPVVVAESGGADAPTAVVGSSGDVARKPTPTGVVGGTGKPGSHGTSLNPNAKGTKIKKGKGLGGAGVSVGALRAGYLRQLVPRVRKEYFYPKISRRLGQEGRVLVAITINAQGEILSVEIYKASPHAALNKAALQSLKRLGKLPKPPEGLLKDGKMRIIVPMVYSMKSQE